jgi:type IV secretory pathway VirB9-like protein
MAGVIGRLAMVMKPHSRTQYHSNNSKKADARALWQLRNYKDTDAGKSAHSSDDGEVHAGTSWQTYNGEEDDAEALKSFDDGKKAYAGAL